MLERFLLPIAPYLFMTAGLSLCVFIFASLKREVHSLRVRLYERETEQDTASGELQAQIAEMRAELRAAEERTAQLVPPAPARSGLNLNVRTQALRMLRHGAAAESIASKLGLPRHEVALLLKVHQLSAEMPASPSTAERATSSSAAY